jgi:uncharacterized DUF497 family protein
MEEEFTLFKNRFIWHNAKNELNKKKHGISFEEATGVFDDPFLWEKYDIENSLGEERFRVVGTITGFIQGKLVTVSVTYRDEFVRIFSARPAEPAEMKEYNNGLKEIFG